MRVRLPRHSDHRRPALSRLRPRHGARGGKEPEHRSPAVAAEEPPGAPLAYQSSAMTPERRAREGGGPEDRAHYACPCGYGFQARVSTSVHCPHCGDTQAW